MTVIEATKNLLPILDAIEQETGHRPHTSTAIRWRTRGAKGVRLAASRIGGRWFTTIDNVRDFIAAVNETRGESPQKIVTPRHSEKAAEAAAMKLAKRLSRAGSK